MTTTRKDRDDITGYASEKGWSAPEPTQNRLVLIKGGNTIDAQFAGEHSAPGQQGMLATLLYRFGGENFGKHFAIAAGDAAELDLDMVDICKKWLDGKPPNTWTMTP